MSARLSISLCCFLGGLVLLVSMVINMSAKNPSYPVVWVMGIAGVALIAAGAFIRRTTQ